MPKRAAGESVEGIHLVRAGDIKHSIGGQRCGLQAKSLMGKIHFSFSDETFAVVICLADYSDWRSHFRCR